MINFTEYPGQVFQHFVFIHHCKDKKTKYVIFCIEKLLAFTKNCKISQVYGEGGDTYMERFHWDALGVFGGEFPLSRDGAEEEDTSKTPFGAGVGLAPAGSMSDGDALWFYRHCGGVLLLEGEVLRALRQSS